MGLFNDEEETDDTSQQDAGEAQGDLEQAEVEDVNDATSNGSTAPGSSQDPELEKALKDLAARMSVLQSNVETVKDARGDLEDKLEDMESRMHRLGGLAEAVSSQYNPFLSENAPGEPTWEGADPPSDDDEPLTPVAPADGPSPAGPEDEPTSGAPGGETPGAQDQEPATAETAEPISEPQDPVAEPPEEEPDAPAEPEAAPAEDVDPEEIDADDLEKMQAMLTDVRDVAERQEAAKQREPRIRERLLLLEWVGLMMRRVGRAGLMDLMEYYEGLGWLDADTKNKALRVAVGIDAPDRVGEGGWRGDLDLHERSLMAIERLQGDEITQAELEELQMDMQRLFDR